jgi:hypothetical protein
MTELLGTTRLMPLTEVLPLFLRLMILMLLFMEYAKLDFRLGVGTLVQKVLLVLTVLTVLTVRQILAPLVLEAVLAQETQEPLEQKGQRELLVHLVSLAVQ